MSAFLYDKDAAGIVTLTMNMAGPVNCMNAEYRAAMEEAVTRLEAESGLIGVIIASAKKVFFAGGDLNELLAFKPGEEADFMALIAGMKLQLRRLERLPVPVVAAINGAAMGGGLEICLACNRRIAVDDKSVQIGFPEVTLGLLPGAGGIVRTVNLLGLEKALPYLIEGHRIGAKEALAAGLIDEVVPSGDELLPRARAWILENSGHAESAVQPWDRKGHKIPGGKAGTPALAGLIAMAPPMLRKKTRGLLPAPERILDCAIEATRLPFDTALTIESRGLTYLVGTPQAKNLITTMFFQMNQVNGGASRPAGQARTRVRRLGVIGAGMMGQGIAFVAAQAGIEVVLQDVSHTAAEKGKSYSEQLLSRQVTKGRLDDVAKRAVLNRIQPSCHLADLDGCDLVIETVFENFELKKEVIAASEPYLADGGVFASNTSSLPITRLVEAAARPEQFIGIHFFSPVDRMPLVEIICGAGTSPVTLAKAYDFAVQIRKTPIVVNDSLGFYTSRTFATYTDEGVRLLHEGANPVQIESLAKALGMPVGPLAVQDEVSLQLSARARATWQQMGIADQLPEQHVFSEVIGTLMAAHGRGGRHHGGGFYEYAEDGSKRIWPKLFELYHRAETDIPDADMRDRLLFRQVLETLRCLEEGVLRSVADGNVGSILGIGAPAWTGGFIQFVNTYGADRFVARCRELAHRYGQRFEPPQIVVDKAHAGERFA